MAELTTLNPNVLYELGLCHGLRVPTVLLAQSMDEVPFDLRPYRILVYSIRFDQVHKLSSALREIGERHKRGEVVFGSPVVDFFPAEAEALAIISSDVNAEAVVEEINGDEEDKGWLDFFIEGNQSGEELLGIIDELTQETAKVGSRIQVHADRLNVLASSPGPGTAAQIHKVALLSASDMNIYSGAIEKILPRLEDSVGGLAENYSRLVTIKEPESEPAIEGLRNFRQTFAQMLEGTRGGLEGIRSFRDIVATLKGISREISRASRRVASSLDSVLSLMEQIEAFCVRTLQVIDDKLKDSDA